MFLTVTLICPPCVGEVTRDFHGGPAVDTPEMVQAYEDAYAKNTEIFFERHSNDEQQKRAKLLPLKQKLVPNKDLDSTKQGTFWQHVAYAEFNHVAFQGMCK